ncbi:hypothetical protein NGB36_05450 [Streptomyces sp. RB6PN25]|uniref:Integral membrane protein n=1 Tax=Streptomyces humicola TaxID=2953240 RepID=A0ABT1PQW0_9ACTN|nr:hypothetical protein [Streptomyces humicola]MCQ4080051.1 hypothetical protein [Streptomyces humicola]
MQARRFVCAAIAAGVAVLAAAPVTSAAPVAGVPGRAAPPAAGPGSIVTVYDEPEHDDVRVIRQPRGGVRTGLGGSVRTSDPAEVAAGAALLVGAVSGAGIVVYRRRARRAA